MDVDAAVCNHVDAAAHMDEDVAAQKSGGRSAHPCANATPCTATDVRGMGLDAGVGTECIEEEGSGGGKVAEETDLGMSVCGGGDCVCTSVSLHAPAAPVKSGSSLGLGLGGVEVALNHHLRGKV